MLKKIIFWVILMIPLIILLSVIVSFSYNIYRLNTFDLNLTCPESDDGFFSEHSGIREAEDVIIGDDYVEYYNPNGAGFEGPGIKRFNYSAGDDLVYVFGASSIAAPEYDKVFPYYLEKRLKNINNKIKIINFGMDGLSSDHIMRRINGALDNEIKPKMIILYMGHNDYDRVYWEIKNKVDIVTRTFILNRAIKVFERMRFNHYEFTEEMESSTPSYIPYYTNIDWVIEPNVKKLLFMTGLINVRQEEFDKCNRFIVHEYSRYVKDIIMLCKNEDISLIIITPVSNLEAEPFGIRKYTTEIYDKGMEEKNYAKRIKYLAFARDNEIFSGHMRAKSELNDFLRSINEPNVYVLDLEKELIERQFQFGYNDFYDYVHMREDTHKIIGDILFDFISGD